jgi:superfamily II DNA or RNA helicase
MRVETVQPNGPGAWVVGLVGMQSERFRRVTLTAGGSRAPAHRSLHPQRSFDGDGRLLRLGLQAYALGIAYEFDPYFGLSISRVDPAASPARGDLRLPAEARPRAVPAGRRRRGRQDDHVRPADPRARAARPCRTDPDRLPANLAFQWQRELKEKFDTKFLVMKGQDIREQFGVNQWLERSRVITSLDLAKRDEILPGLRQVHWDLVIVDEAHRMSAADESHKSLRYKLGELLRDSSDHMLLLTATPHKGDPQNFSLFLQLLDADAYADVKSIREAMNRRRAPFYLRRTKEAMVYFPERRDDGTWAAEPIFTKRIPHTVDFQIDGDEFELYRDVTRFVKRESARAAAEGEDPRARAIGFLMSLYQRRLASSTYAMRRSLENRARRLEEGLKRAQDLARQAPPDLPDPEELEEMEEGERERLERCSRRSRSRAAPTRCARSAGAAALAVRAQAVEDSGAEAKLSELKEPLQQEGFFDHPEQRLLLFTEFKDTLDYLVDRLKSWGFRVGFIHGGMKPGSRDEPGTRLHAEQQFREGGYPGAGGDRGRRRRHQPPGLQHPLQLRHPLESEPAGTAHGPHPPLRPAQGLPDLQLRGDQHHRRQGAATAAREAPGDPRRARRRRGVQRGRRGAPSGARRARAARLLRGPSRRRRPRGAPAARRRRAAVPRDLPERSRGARQQEAQPGDADRAARPGPGAARRAGDHRALPARGGGVRAAGRSSRALRAARFRAGAHAAVLRRYEKDPTGSCPPSPTATRAAPPTATRPRREARMGHAGHPLFEAIRRHTHVRALDVLGKGATFHSLQHEQPARIDFYRARIVDGLGQVVHERLFAVEIDGGGEPRLQEPGCSATSRRPSRRRSCRRSRSCPRRRAGSTSTRWIRSWRRRARTG